MSVEKFLSEHPRGRQIWSELSGRQRRVAEMHDQGRTRDQMAEALGCSVRTVAREIYHLRDVSTGRLCEPPRGLRIHEHLAEMFKHPVPRGLSKSAVHRRRQNDPEREALASARRMLRRARRLIEANERKATAEAWRELEMLGDELAAFRASIH